MRSSRATRKAPAIGIHCDDDGLLAAGEPGVQLTWMDAKVGDWVVTPRIGKPVEIQALWLNALLLAGDDRRQWKQLYGHGKASFLARFWNETRGCLYDVVDNDHIVGKIDRAFRPTRFLRLADYRSRSLKDRMHSESSRRSKNSLLTPLACARSPRGNRDINRTTAETAPTRRRISSGDRVALADGRFRRGVGAQCAPRPRRRRRKRAINSSNRCWRISMQPVSAICQKSRMRRRHIRRADARFRRGRSRKRSASADISPENR